MLIKDIAGNILGRCRCLAVLGVLTFIIACTGCNTTPPPTRYLAVNIHCRTTRGPRGSNLIGSYLNYIGKDSAHIMIPVNSPVRVHEWDRGFALELVGRGSEVLMEYNAGLMKMDLDSYLGLITSPLPVSLDDFSELDRKGIRNGEVLQGMTRNAVRVAWGEPARHATPLLEMDRWTYWRNRWRKRLVVFKDGVVSDVR